MKAAEKHSTDKVIAEIINMTNAGAVCEKIDKNYVDVKEETTL